MALNPHIGRAFWSDEDVAELTPEQKLAWLYVLTSENISNIGVFTVTRRTFEFETGLPWKALQGACEGLPRGLTGACQERNAELFVLNWVKHSIYQGKDPATIRHDNRIRNLPRLFANLPEEWRQKFAAIYPGLVASFPPLKIPEGEAGAGGPSKPLGGGRSDQIRSDLSVPEGGVGETRPSIREQIMAYAASFPGEAATGTPGPIPAATACRFLDFYTGPERTIPTRWQAVLTRWWVEDFAADKKAAPAAQIPADIIRLMDDVESDGELEPAHYDMTVEELTDECEKLDLKKTAHRELRDNLLRLIKRRKREAVEREEVMVA